MEYHLFLLSQIYRNVSTGEIGATAVAPKFSNNLTLSPPDQGVRLCPPSQRLQLNFPRGYLPDIQCDLSAFSCVSDRFWPVFHICTVKKECRSKTKQLWNFKNSSSSERILTHCVLLAQNTKWMSWRSEVTDTSSAKIVTVFSKVRKTS